MRPTNPPDDFDYGMPGEEGAYEYENYDEDDFFYHMYFDEVSTTPLPDEFYDILESVSSGGSSQVQNYPDYFDYLLNSRVKEPGNNTDEATVEAAAQIAASLLAAEQRATAASHRQSKNTRYLQLGENKRRNSRVAQLGARRASRSQPSEARHTWPRTRHTRAAPGFRIARTGRARKGNNKAKKRRQRRKQQRADPRIIGILDRRVPAQFRQNPFVTVSLASFVVLSTGVTTGTVQCSTY